MDYLRFFFRFLDCNGWFRIRPHFIQPQICCINTFLKTDDTTNQAIVSSSILQQCLCWCSDKKTLIWYKAGGIFATFWLSTILLRSALLVGQGMWDASSCTGGTLLQFGTTLVGSGLDPQRRCLHWDFKMARINWDCIKGEISDPQIMWQNLSQRRNERCLVDKTLKCTEARWQTPTEQNMNMTMESSSFN